MVASVFLWDLCGYVWVNMLTLSPPRGITKTNARCTNKPRSDFLRKFGWYLSIKSKICLSLDLHVFLIHTAKISKFDFQWDWVIVVNLWNSNDSWNTAIWHCPRTVGTPYFVSAPDCPVDRTTIICKPHIGRKIVRDIKRCLVIFFPQSYSRPQTEMYDDRSAFCRGQWATWNLPLV